MKCPNRKCRKQTGKLVIKFTTTGKKLEGCPLCMPLSGTPSVRTGKKIWAGSQVYTPSQLEEKNHAFFDRTAKRAAENRKRFWRPSQSGSNG